MRIKILILLSILWFSCEGQIPVVSVMTSRVGLTDETADGKQVYVILGDSKTGTSNGVGPTISSGIAYEWDREDLMVKEVTSGDFQYINSIGSQWPRFCIQYNANTGKKPVIVEQGVGGTRWFSSTASQSWYTNGTRYSDAVTNTNACLAYLELTKPKGVFIILGINDLNNGVGDVSVYATSLIDRINTDWDFPPIYISIPSQTNSMTSANAATMKTYLRSLEVIYSNVHAPFNEATLFSNGYTHDNVHFNTTGNNVFGIWAANYVSSSETDKDIRRVLNANFVTTLTSGEQTAYSTFISQGKADGWWDDLSSLQVYKASQSTNKLTDINGLIAPQNSSADVSNTGYISTNGSSTYVRTQFNPNTVIKGTATVNSFIAGLRIGTNSTSAGTTATIFGASSGSGREYIRQINTNGTLWSANTTAEVTYATDNAIVSDVDYAIVRTASNAQALYKDGASVSTSSTASAAAPDFELYIGARNAGGAASDYINCQHICFYYFTGDTTAYALFRSDLTTLLSGL